MKRYCRRLVWLTLAVVLTVPPQAYVHAEDIDLFVGRSPPPDPSSNTRPNVLFIIDNSANWSAQSQHWTDGSAQGESELRALREVIGSLGDNINIGLMMFAPGRGQNKDGGYVRFAIRQMTPANKLALQQQLGVDGCAYNVAGDPMRYNSVTGSLNCILRGFQDPIEQTATADTEYSAALFEAFKYFGGFTDPANANANPQDAHLNNQGPSGFGPFRYAGDPDPKSDPYAYTPLDTFPATSTNRNTYLPPVSNRNTCANNYIIFIGNGFPTQDAATELQTLLKQAYGDPVPQQPMPQVTTTTSEQIIFQGLSGNTCQSQNECVAALQAAFPNRDNYTCTVGTSTTSTGCKGQDRKKWDTKVSNNIISVTFPPTGISTVPAVNEARFADEWANYLQHTDVNGAPTDNVGGQIGAPGPQNITIFTIDVFKDNQDERQTRLMYNMAKLGGGDYFQATSEAQIKAKIEEALRKIQAKSSVFAAASLPVSATNRAQSENQVFFGLFRPDKVANPRWYGNLKRYQVARSGPDLILADKDGNNAVNSQSGFFDECAASFWTTNTTVFSATPPTDQSYWVFSPDSARKLACSQYPPATFSTFSDLPDGEVVEKGGAAEVLRRGNNPTAPTSTYSSGMRNIYTCVDVASCGIQAGVASPGMVAFDTTSASGARIGVADGSAEHTRIIDYTRGKDVGTVSGIIPPGGENNNGSTTDTRPSIHGDVVHSRPLPVNYSIAANDGQPVVAYYGANDGALRAVRTSDGKELWSFVAPEHHFRLKRLSENSPIVSFPGQPPGGEPKDYFFDGTMGLFQNANNSAIWLFPTMRRGGRSIYGFDVTNVNQDPPAPRLMWRVGCPSTSLTESSNCTPGFEDIGQTWSTPNLAFIRGAITGMTTPVIVVGGGYDTCEDEDNKNPSCSNAKGRKVYVLRADTGDLLASFNTARSVAADVTLLDRNFDGAVDHAYIADTGGNLYRIDFVNASTVAALPAPVSGVGGACAGTEWCITKIANTDSSDGRKFLFPPAAFFGRVNNSHIAILTLGSGDRERPLPGNYPVTAPVLNRFYAFVDLFSTNSSDAVNFDTAADSVITDITPLTTLTTCIPDIRGWRLDLRGMNYPAGPNDVPKPGEQTVTSSLIAGGKVFFNTHRAEQSDAAAGVCSAGLGEARGYSVDLFCGSRFNVVYEGGGIPISPVQGTVELAGGSVVTFVIGAPASQSATNPFTPGKVTPVVAPVRSRLFWYRHGDK